MRFHIPQVLNFNFYLTDDTDNNLRKRSINPCSHESHKSENVIRKVIKIHEITDNYLFQFSVEFWERSVWRYVGYILFGIKQ